MAIWACGSVEHAAVTSWAALTAYSIGALRRNLAAPAVGSERVWRCTTAGTSGAAEPTWTTTKGSTTNDGSVVWTEVTGNSTYGWSAPHARYVNALAWLAAGDDCYLSHANACTQAAALTLTSPGTAAAGLCCRTICVNSAGSWPPVSADLRSTATISTTGANDISTLGFMDCYGVTLVAGSGAVTANINFNSTAPWHWTFNPNDSSSKLKLGGTAGGFIQIGANSAAVDDMGLVLNNTKLEFSSTSSFIFARGPFTWRNTLAALAGAVFPTTLFAGGTANPAQVEVSDVDLSALTSGKNLVNMNAASPSRFMFRRVGLGPSVAPTTLSIPGPGGSVFDLIDGDSSDTNYRRYHQDYGGLFQNETTIVRTGGASDGTTAFSFMMVSSANTSPTKPLFGPWIKFRNESLSSTTIDIYTVTDGVTGSNADWKQELIYLGTSGTPLGVLATDGLADVLASGTNHTVAGTWTTTGLSSPVLQRSRVTFTPVKAGEYWTRLCLIRPSTTLYLCPKIVSTSGRQYLDRDGNIINGPTMPAAGAVLSGTAVDFTTGTLFVPTVVHQLGSGILAIGE